MKNLLLTLIFGSLLISSCDSSLEPKPSALLSINDDEKSLIIENDCDQPTNHIITLEMGARYIATFLNSPKGKIYMQASQSNPSGNGLGIGNYISLDVLTDVIQLDYSNKANEGNPGIIFHDLFDGSHSLFALNYAKICKSSDRSQYHIDNESTYFVTSSILEDPTNLDESSIVNYLGMLVIDPANLEAAVTPIMGQTVAQLNQALINKTGGDNEHTSGGSFFFNLSDFRALTQSTSSIVKGFVIFRGTEVLTENNISHNHDRLVLIAVNDLGQLMTQNHTILERSWPPKRFQTN